MEFRGKDWNELAQDRDSWRAVVNEVMIISQLGEVIFFSLSICQYFCNVGGWGGGGWVCVNASNFGMQTDK